MDSNSLVIVLAGKNKALIDELEKKFNKDKVRVIPYTKKVEIFMAASDILLSKPGGLSSTEAAVKGIPLIHTMPIPGCEAKNANFFSKKNMSIKATTIDEIVKSTNKLLNSNKLCFKLVKSQNMNINKLATSDICDFILK